MFTSRLFSKPSSRESSPVAASAAQAAASSASSSPSPSPPSVARRPPDTVLLDRVRNLRRALFGARALRRRARIFNRLLRQPLGRTLRLGLAADRHRPREVGRSGPTPPPLKHPHRQPPPT